MSNTTIEFDFDDLADDMPFFEDVPVAPDGSSYSDGCYGSSSIATDSGLVDTTSTSGGSFDLEGSSRQVSDQALLIQAFRSSVHVRRCCARDWRVDRESGFPTEPANCEVVSMEPIHRKRPSGLRALIRGLQSISRQGRGVDAISVGSKSQELC